MNLALVRERLDLYEKLMRLDKPIGILLLLWPTLWALWIASGGRPGWLLAWIFILGTALMRSAGCVVNDYADRDFDKHVERTKERPLTAGKVSVGEALALATVLMACAALLILPLSALVWQLAFVAAFLAVSYPFTKRFFAIPQAYLGIAFGFGIPMAFAAVQEAVPPLAWWMLVANIAWAIAYDTEYAMVDRDDDLRIGIKTSAITFGRFDVAAVMLSYGIAIAILALIGTQLRFGLFYFAGLTVATAIALYHWTLIRGRERMACFKAFRHNNWLGAAVFAGIVGELNLHPLL
ncbi:MAG TPA: 4-hydroxybenzoate octaprenyltransferase [Rhodocyclaceae bacterium]|nr:4-hydroxybenzoate octaprenyltransferase [Rhodocyclaceae bacterium]